ncbi:MAG: 2OG-Fe(II) oxygenase [Hyphomicrobium sp.]
MIERDAIQRAPVAREPFPYFLAEKVLSSDVLAAAQRDFPAITQPGVFPLKELSYGLGFADLIDGIRSRELEELLEQKFDVELADKPLMITVRGRCQKKDGRIHTDSTDKIVTCLLYLNDTWSEDGGRLRLLRNGTDIDDVIAEIPPNGGTFVAFKRTDNSWHGHHPFEGPRRYIMFNWVRSEAALVKNIGRHTLSAKLKRLNPFA